MQNLVLSHLAKHLGGKTKKRLKKALCEKVNKILRTSRKIKGGWGQLEALVIFVVKNVYKAVFKKVVTSFEQMLSNQFSPHVFKTVFKQVFKQFSKQFPTSFQAQISKTAFKHQNS